MVRLMRNFLCLRVLALVTSTLHHSKRGDKFTLHAAETFMGGKEGQMHVKHF